MDSDLMTDENKRTDNNLNDKPKKTKSSIRIKKLKNFLIYF